MSTAHQCELNKFVCSRAKLFVAGPFKADGDGYLFLRNFIVADNFIDRDLFFRARQQRNLNKAR